MKPSNVIVIMTDELRRDCLGCYGNDLIQTPHLDALAARGIRYDAAYTPSPICVPARAAIATGRYVHETGNWSNAIPYCGTPESWHHRFKSAGRRIASVGKLHFRSTEDDNGFSEEIQPFHVKDGKGWIHGLLRDEMDLFDASGFAANIGPGDDPYSQFDLQVCKATKQWLTERSDEPDNTSPWGLFVSFLRPHYPLTCPPEFYNLYNPDELPLPRNTEPNNDADHPVLQGLKEACNYDAPFNDDTRRIAVASYYGLCSFVDDMVGGILNTLTSTGLDRNTTIVFTSDHGECLGDRGFWTKMVMYEESAAVPLIIAGPGIEQNVCSSPVSLIDLYPTVLELGGVQSSDEIDVPVNGVSLIDSAKGTTTGRSVLSEYHDYGAKTGMFMLRKGSWKLVVYPGYNPQLFNLDKDPDETQDLAHIPDYSSVLGELNKELENLCNPAKINQQAFADQARRIDELGGKQAILATENYDHTPVP